MTRELIICPELETASLDPISTMVQPSPPNFRLPAQPTILLKDPSQETIARLRQLAPYYWSHPQTTNCAIHFPIDIRHQNRIVAYQSRVRIQQQRVKASQGGGAVDGSSSPPIPVPAPRRGSWTPPNQPHQRLKSSRSSSTIHGRAAILGSSEPPVAGGERRGSLTPGYDPFSRSGTTVIPSAPTPPVDPGFAAYSRRESAPLGSQKHLSAPPSILPQHLAPQYHHEIHRRGSAPGTIGGPVKGTPMRTVRLHVEFLTAHSALIRHVLAKAAGFPSLDAAAQSFTQPQTPSPSPTNHDRTTIPPSPTSSNGEQPASHVADPSGGANSLPTPPQEPSTPNTTSGQPTSEDNLFPHSFFRFSPQRYPRVITNPATGPVIILPVPDPASFPLLIHYMYFGKLDNIERTLREGQVTWEGLVKNVEYLGLRDDVKRYLGRWWKKWRDGRMGAGDEDRTQSNVDEEDEEEVEPIHIGGKRRRFVYRDSEMDPDPDVDMEWVGGHDCVPSNFGMATHHSSISLAHIDPGATDELTGLLDRF